MKLKLVCDNILLTVTVVMLSLMFSGCQQIPQTPLKTWFETMQATADTLNQQHIGGSNYIIEPLLGDTQYPIGTTFEDVTPYKVCQVPNNVISNLPMTDLPAIDSTNSFTFSFQLPSILSTLVSGGIDLTNKKSYYMKFANLTNEFIYEDDLEFQLTNNNACNNWVKSGVGQKRSIVRGYILASLQFSTSKTFNVGASVTATNIGSFNVQYDANGDIVINQTNETRWFGVYSDVEAISTQVTGQQALLAALTNSPHEMFAMSVNNKNIKDVDIQKSLLEHKNKPVILTRIHLAPTPEQTAIDLGKVTQAPIEP